MLPIADKEKISQGYKAINDYMEKHPRDVRKHSMKLCGQYTGTLEGQTKQAPVIDVAFFYLSCSDGAEEIIKKLMSEIIGKPRKKKHQNCLSKTREKIKEIITT